MDQSDIGSDSETKQVDKLDEKDTKNNKPIEYTEIYAWGGTLSSYIYLELLMGHQLG